MTRFISALFFSLNLFCHQLWADLSNYKPGHGSNYSLTLPASSAPASLQLATVSASKNHLTVEVQAQVQGLAGLGHLVQRFTMKKIGGRFKVTEGYIKSPLLGSNPQKLPPEYLTGADDSLDLTGFLISENQAKGLKPQRQVELKLAGDKKIKADEYVTEAKGITLKSYLSKKASPYGLAAILSSGPKQSNNYQMAYKGSFKTYTPVIDPKTAVPLSDFAKSILPKISGALSLGIR